MLYWLKPFLNMQDCNMCRKSFLLVLLAILVLLLTFACSSEPTSNKNQSHNHTFVIQDDFSLKCDSCGKVITSSYSGVLNGNTVENVTEYPYRIEYTNTSSQDVILYADNCDVYVNAPFSTVTLYGVAKYVAITSVSDHSFICNAETDYVSINKGNLVLNTVVKSLQIYPAEGANVTVSSNEIINHLFISGPHDSDKVKITAEKNIDKVELYGGCEITLGNDCYVKDICVESEKVVLDGNISHIDGCSGSKADCLMDNENKSVHIHEYGTWEFDETSHWRVSICNDLSNEIQRGTHIWDSGTKIKTSANIATSVIEYKCYCGKTKYDVEIPEKIEIPDNCNLLGTWFYLFDSSISFTFSENGKLSITDGEQTIEHDWCLLDYDQIHIVSGEKSLDLFFTCTASEFAAFYTDRSQGYKNMWYISRTPQEGVYSFERKLFKTTSYQNGIYEYGLAGNYIEFPDFNLCGFSRPVSAPIGLENERDQYQSFLRPKRNGAVVSKLYDTDVICLSSYDNGSTIYYCLSNTFDEDEMIEYTEPFQVGFGATGISTKTKNSEGVFSDEYSITISQIVPNAPSFSKTDNYVDYDSPELFNVKILSKSSSPVRLFYTVDGSDPALSNTSIEYHGEDIPLFDDEALYTHIRVLLVGPNYETATTQRRFMKKGPAGGVIIAKNTAYSGQPEDWRYLEMEISPIDTAPFGVLRDTDNQIINIPTNASGIGAGFSNTNNLIELLGEEAFTAFEIYDLRKTSHYAAKIATDYEKEYEGELFSDWYLPSARELDQFFAVTTASCNQCWSSTVGSDNKAYYRANNSVTHGFASIIYEKNVIPIRDVK